MVHRVYARFLRLGNGGGLVDLLPVGCRGAARFIVEMAVHLLGPAGGGFVDGVIGGYFRQKYSGAFFGRKKGAKFVTYIVNKFSAEISCIFLWKGLKNWADEIGR